LQQLVGPPEQVIVVKIAESECKIKYGWSTFAWLVQAFLKFKISLQS